MHDENENINIKIETIKEENQTEILRLNTTITEWKTLLETLKQKQELEKRSFEIIKSKEQKKQKTKKMKPSEESRRDL